MKKAFLVLGALSLASLLSAWGYDYEMVVTQDIQGVKRPYTWSFDVNHKYVNDDPTCKYVTIKKVTPRLVGAQSIPNAFHYFNTDVMLFVKEIGDSVFANSYGLTSVSIPQTVEAIGDYVFSNCTSLESVDFSTGLRYIGKAPFVNTLLKAITLPDTLLDMAGNISAGAIYAIDINIGENSHFVNTEDGLLLNKDQTRLYACATRAEGTVELPATLLEIKPDAFFGCFRLESLEIPASVTTIGERAFNVSGIWPGLSAPESTPKLQAVAYLGTDPNAIAVPENAADYIYVGAPESLTSYADTTAWTSLVETGWQGRKVVVDGEKHSEKEEDGAGIVWSYDVYNGGSRLGGEESVTPVVDTTTTGDVIIPAQLGGRDVVEIGVAAFEGCASIGSIHIPATTTNIEASAFVGCTNLSAFVVDAANPNYFAKNGVLYKRGDAGAELVKVPAKFLFALQAAEKTTENTTTILEVVKGVEIINGQAVVYPNEITVEEEDKKTLSETTTSFEPEISEEALLNGVTRIADYAFADCGYLPSGSIVRGTLTVCTNGKTQRTTGLVTMPVGTDSVSTTQMTTNILEALVVNDKAAWRKRIVGTETSVVSKTIRPDTTSIACGEFAWANSFWEEDDAFSMISETSTSTQISIVLSTVADPLLKKNITTPGDFMAFRRWAEGVKTSDRVGLVGIGAVKNSMSAWYAYALNSDCLPEKNLTSSDIKMEELKIDATGGCNSTISIKGLSIGPSALEENLKKVFLIEGNDALSKQAFSKNNVVVSFAKPHDGKVRVSLTPTSGKSSSFFLRVNLKR